MSGDDEVPFCGCHVTRHWETGHVTGEPFCFAVGGLAGCPEAHSTVGGSAAVRPCNAGAEDIAQALQDERVHGQEMGLEYGFVAVLMCAVLYFCRKKYTGKKGVPRSPGNPKRRSSDMPNSEDGTWGP